jgi:hypothetical protein
MPTTPTEQLPDEVPITTENGSPTEEATAEPTTNPMQGNLEIIPWIPNGSEVMVGEPIVIGINYDLSYTGNFYIQCEPNYVTIQPTNLSYSGSPAYPPGVGTGGSYFTFIDGEVNITSIVCNLYAEDGTTLLGGYEKTVEYHVVPHIDRSISNVTFDPPDMSSLSFNSPLKIQFSYNIPDVNGYAIQVVPYNSGIVVPNYSPDATTLFPTGEGSGTLEMTITSGTGYVAFDLVHIMIYKADLSSLVESFFVVGRFTFQ